MFVCKQQLHDLEFPIILFSFLLTLVVPLFCSINPIQCFLSALLLLPGLNEGLYLGAGAKTRHSGVRLDLKPGYRYVRNPV